MIYYTDWTYTDPDTLQYGRCIVPDKIYEFREFNRTSYPVTFAGIKDNDLFRDEIFQDLWNRPKYWFTATIDTSIYTPEEIRLLTSSNDDPLHGDPYLVLSKTLFKSIVADLIS